MLMTHIGTREAMRKTKIHQSGLALVLSDAFLSAILASIVLLVYVVNVKNSFARLHFVEIMPKFNGRRLRFDRRLQSSP
jgi:hypothetical protein